MISLDFKIFHLIKANVKNKEEEGREGGRTEGKATLEFCHSGNLPLRLRLFRCHFFREVYPNC